MSTVTPPRRSRKSRAHGVVSDSTNKPPSPLRLSPSDSPTAVAVAAANTNSPSTTSTKTINSVPSTASTTSTTSSHPSSHRKLPNSFLSSFRIHEALVENLQILPHALVKDLNRWIICFVLVQFDVDIGPDLKIIRPAIRFSEDEFKTICFSSLPEHTSNAVLDSSNDDYYSNQQQFHTFRFVHNRITMYANCLFSQCRDSSRSRGYLQESLVIISSHYFPVLFQTCLNEIMAPHNSFLDYSLDHKVPLLDSAINNIAQWPDITYDKPLELGFLGSIIDITLPPRVLINPLNNQVLLESWEKSFLKYFPDLTDLYMIYECLILCRSIIIYSSNPHLCSTFIHSIIDLIAPIPYNRRIREYVTIHSFPNNFNDGIVGLTNPFLLRGIETMSNPIPYIFLLINNSKHSSDPQQIEEEKKLRNLIKQSNKLITKNKFLLPDTKFLQSLSTTSTTTTTTTTTSIDHSIRFHFATLTSRLISPLSGYFGTHLEFNDRIFNRELAKHDWNQNLDKLFNSHPSQSMLHRISARAFNPTSSSSSRTSTSCKQLFYREFVTSANMDLWLQGNGVSRRGSSSMYTNSTTN